VRELLTLLYTLLGLPQAYIAKRVMCTVLESSLTYPQRREDAARHSLIPLSMLYVGNVRRKLSTCGHGIRAPNTCQEKSVFGVKKG